MYKTHKVFFFNKQLLFQERLLKIWIKIRNLFGCLWVASNIKLEHRKSSQNRNSGSFISLVSIGISIKSPFVGFQTLFWLQQLKKLYYILSVDVRRIWPENCQNMNNRPFSRSNCNEFTVEISTLQNHYSTQPSFK